MSNKKSDVNAKNEFVKYLQEKGYEAKVAKEPADIEAKKDGQTWYFEIKMTKQKEQYFGAATLTEWKQAVLDPEHFRFIVAQTNAEESAFEFIEYTPEEFMEFSTIPPFKIFFNVDLNDRYKVRGKKSRSAALTLEKIAIMNECYDKIKR